MPPRRVVVPPRRQDRGKEEADRRAEKDPGEERDHVPPSGAFTVAITRLVPDVVME